ncbi:MAG: esterase-like activity of phytase family protein, partial [Dehalococcoidia bacterium]
MKLGPLPMSRPLLTHLVVPFLSLVVLTVLLAPRIPFDSRPALPAEAAALAGGGVPVTIHAWFDLPKSDARSAEFSGITWDGAQHILYAITDDAPRIIPVTPSSDYRTWTFGDPIAVEVSGDWDGEGIVLTPDGFFISNEFGPAIVRLDREGRALAEVPVPEHFQRILRNRGFEALTLSPDGRYLFAANESPLEGDGPQPTAEQGGLVRILRHDLSSGEQTEYAYRTDPIFATGEGGDRGVGDMIALSGTDLLV